MFKAITADNGSEFLDRDSIKKAAKWGRFTTRIHIQAGSVEATKRGNRILRRFIPKGMDLNNVIEDQLQRYKNWVRTTCEKYLDTKLPMKWRREPRRSRYFIAKKTGNALGQLKLQFAVLHGETNCC